MEILPVPEKENNNTIDVKQVKSAVDAANKGAKDGMVRSVQMSNPPTPSTGSVLANVIRMECGTPTCSNIRSVTSPSKSSPCANATDKDACGKQPFCAWKQAPTNVTSYAYCNKICPTCTDPGGCAAKYGKWVKRNFPPGVYRIRGDPRGTKYLRIDKAGTTKLTDNPGDVGWKGKDITFPPPDGACAVNKKTSVYYGCWGGCNSSENSPEYLCMNFALKNPNCPKGYVELGQVTDKQGFDEKQIKNACKKWYKDTFVPKKLSTLAPKTPSDPATTRGCNQNACVEEKGGGFNRQMIPANAGGNVNWCSDGYSQGSPFNLQKSNCASDWTEYPTSLTGYPIRLEPLMVLSGCFMLELQEVE